MSFRNGRFRCWVCDVGGDSIDLTARLLGLDATSIAEFLSAHAVAAYQIMGADEEHENARYLWRRIGSTGQDEMSKRDLWQLCKGKFKRVEDMEPALQTLVNMGYIRLIEVATGGRPTKKLFVNPKTKSIKSIKSIKRGLADGR